MTGSSTTAASRKPRAAARILLLICLFGTPSVVRAQCQKVSFGGVGGQIVFFGNYGTALGDFNNDGIPDLVSMNSNDVSILLGDGIGSFGPATTFVVGYPAPPGIAQPSAVVVADLNGDGKPDVAIAYEGEGFAAPGGIAVLLGDGHGGLGGPSYYLVGGGAFVGLVVDDFTGDGKPDLAVLDFYGGINVLPGDGLGGFGGPIVTSISGGLGLAAGDFNDDGEKDLAVLTGTADSQINLLLGDGTGHFGTPAGAALGYRAGSLAVGDFDKDGKLDVAVTGNGVEIFFGDGGGFFSGNRSFAVGQDSNAILAADLDGDGKLDLLVGNIAVNASGGTDNVVSTLRGDGAGGFAPPVNYSTGLAAGALVLGDLNGDGHSDLVIGTSGQTVTLMGDGSGGFRTPGAQRLSTGLNNTPRYVAVGDFNGDHKPDLVVSAGNNLQVFLGDGSGGFGAGINSPLLGSPAGQIAVADFNGDGKLDVVASVGIGEFALFLGDGSGGLGAPSYISVGNYAGGIAAADVDDDGKPDVVILTSDLSGVGHVSVYLGDGTGNFAAPTTYPVGNGPSGIVLADFNGDGRPDIAVADSTSNDVAILLGTGGGSFGLTRLISLAGSGSYGPAALVSGDFNGDGRADLAVVASGGVLLLLGNGNGTFAPPVAYSFGSVGPTGIVAADFNGDGKLDLAVTSETNEVSILLGSGTGTFGSPIGYMTGADPVGIATADFDKNGKTDLAVVEEGTLDVAVFLGTCLPPPTVSSVHPISGSTNGGTPVTIGGTGFVAGATVRIGGAPATSVHVTNSTAITATTSAHAAAKVDVVVANPDGQTGVLSGGFTYVCSAPPPPTAGNNGPICAGQMLQLTASTVAGGTYAWTGPNGFTSALQDPTIPSATIAASGTYTVHVTVAGCTSTGATTSVTVNTTPAAPVAGNSGPICAGQTLQLTASTVSGATYSWTGPNGFTSSQQNPTVPSATTAASGTYRVHVTVGNCSSPDATTAAAVNAVPTTPVAANNGPICAGQILQLTASTVAGATYSWTGPDGFASTLQNPTIPNATTAASGTYNVTISVGGCTSAPAATTAAVHTLPSSTITSPASVCPNSADVAASVPDAGPGAVYSWSITNGTITGGSGTRIIAFSTGRAGPVSLTVTVTGANGCSSTGRASIAVGGACPTSFYTLMACRLIDTRNPLGPLGGPSLVAGASRSFVLVGHCGVPADAISLSVNVVAVKPSSPGHFTIYPGGISRPLASTVNYSSGQIRANNAILTLGGAGDIEVFCGQGSGAADLIVDINGYFR